MIMTIFHSLSNYDWYITQRKLTLVIFFFFHLWLATIFAMIRLETEAIS